MRKIITVLLVAVSITAMAQTIRENVKRDIGISNNDSIFKPPFEIGRSFWGLGISSGLYDTLTAYGIIWNDSTITVKVDSETIIKALNKMLFYEIAESVRNMRIEAAKDAMLDCISYGNGMVTTPDYKLFLKAWRNYRKFYGGKSKMKL